MYIVYDKNYKIINVFKFFGKEMFNFLKDSKAEKGWINITHPAHKEIKDKINIANNTTY